MQELVELARAAASSDTDHFRNSTFAKHVRSTERIHGTEARAELLREVLLQTAETTEPLIDSLKYPPEVLELIHKEFCKIRKVRSCRGNDYFDLSMHSLVCDYRIACFSRVPVGPQHIELDGVPRRLLVCGGLRQGIAFLRMVRKTGGLIPFYSCHMSHDVTPLNFLRVSGPEARDKLFRNIAKCLELNPRILGMFSCAWLNDPKLDEVSPHLSFFRRGVVDNGGILFRFRIGPGGRNAALRNSATRAQLTKEGEYSPLEYAIVWPRRDILDWAYHHTVP